MRRVSVSACDERSRVDFDELWVESKKVCSPVLGLAGESFGHSGRAILSGTKELYGPQVD
jgi:hypothetical protein